jgi:protocatechuate 3,4-dioxygenase beta subunit
MDADDVLVGRLWTRREVIGLMGAAGMALVVGCSDDETRSATPTPGASGGATTAATQAATQAATEGATAATASGSTAAVPSCIVTPELTEGPYFVDEMLDRSDIRSDPSDGSVRDGAEFVLTVNVSTVGGDASCEPLADAMVDVWHCDALGVYSGVSDPMFDTSGEAWLRGFQRTDANGQAQFKTIYPGWYQGRAVHIHFKIRTDDSEFTSQWFFDDDFSAEVFQQEPYAAKGTQTTLNENDGIYGEVGDQLTLTVTQQGAVYAATFDIGLQSA